MLKRALTMPLTVLMLLSCQPASAPPTSLSRLDQTLTPTSKGPKPTEATGSVIASFDLGQNLNPADFQPIEESPNNKWHINCIQSSSWIITITKCKWYAN